MAEATSIEEEARSEESDASRPDITDGPGTATYEYSSEGSLYVWANLVEIDSTSGFISAFQPEYNIDNWTYLDYGELELDYAGTISTINDGDVAIFAQLFISDNGLGSYYQYYNYVVDADQEINISYDDDIEGITFSYAPTEADNLAVRFGGASGSLGDSVASALSALSIQLGQLPDSHEVNNFVPQYLLYPEWASMYTGLEVMGSLTSSASTVTAVTETY